jgi:hypothetical protein
VDFPVLSKDDLDAISLGIYQVNLAKRYTKMHLNEDSEFRILLNNEFAGIVRAKLESRFIQAKTHNLWIQYNSEEEGLEAISAYYCRCKNGSRTVGCCSHVCAVLWYLGFQRHQDPSTLRIRKRSLKIRDAKRSLQRFQQVLQRLVDQKRKMSRSRVIVRRKINLLFSLNLY